MIDKKFTDDNEIIENLTEFLLVAKDGYCSSLENGGMRNRYQEHYIETLTDSINLINRQKAEIKRLKECPKCVYEYDGETIEYCVQGPCPNFKTVEQIKAEAYNEFAERLKNK